MNENKTRSATWEIALTLYVSFQRSAHVDLFIVGDQWSYYNASNAPNYLSRQ
jgi:hypothetical protein